MYLRYGLGIRFGSEQLAYDIFHTHLDKPHADWYGHPRNSEDGTYDLMLINIFNTQPGIRSSHARLQTASSKCNTQTWDCTSLDKIWKHM